DPQRASDLIKRVFQEIEQFKTNGPTAQQAANAKETLLREYETNSLQNAFVLGQFAARYQNGDDISAVYTLPDYYKKVDAAMIQQAAKSYLDVSNHVQVTLLPEKK